MFSGKIRVPEDSAQSKRKLPGPMRQEDGGPSSWVREATDASKNGQEGLRKKQDCRPRSLLCDLSQLHAVGECKS